MGGWGTRGVFLGGEEESERSTFAYVSCASPKDDSGTQARRKDAALKLRAEDDVLGRSSGTALEGFCWTRAMKPGMLSFEEGVGCT